MFSNRRDQLPDGPQPDGTYRLNGALVSQADHEAAMRTKSEAAALDRDVRGQAIGAPRVPAPVGMPPSVPPPSASPASGLPPPGMPPASAPGYVPGVGIDVTGYVGSRYDKDFARNNPQLFQGPPPTSEIITQRQQLADANGKIPGRYYDPANIAKASPAWLTAETNALPGRLDTAALTKALPPGATSAMPGADYLRAGGRDMKTAETLDKVGKPAEVDHTGQPITVSGVPMYWQNPKQVVPLPNPKTQPQYFATPKITEVDGVKFYQTGTGQAPRPLNDGNGGKGLDPLVVGGITQQIAALEQEKVQHQAAIVNGDNRFGFMNVQSRSDRLKEIEADLAGKRAMLGGKGAAPAPEGETAAPAAPAAPATPAAPGAPVAPAAKLYTIQGDKVNFGTDRTKMLQSAQQAVDDGVITADQARELLKQSGYTLKKK